MASVLADPRQLLERLERVGVDDAALVQAEVFFRQHQDEERARWIEHERLGYRRATTAATVRQALGGVVSEGLTSAVVRARVRRGRVRLGENGPVVAWPHFFVEPVVELRRYRDALQPAGPPEVIVDLDVPPGSAEPRSLEFPRQVFEDVLRSIALEIADAIRRMP